MKKNIHFVLKSLVVAIAMAMIFGFTCQVFAQTAGITSVLGSTSTAFPTVDAQKITIPAGGAMQEAVIEITNVEGQLIKTYTATSNKTNIDVSALSGGVYMVEIKTESGIGIRKFVKE